MPKFANKKSCIKNAVGVGAWSDKSCTFNDQDILYEWQTNQMDISALLEIKKNEKDKQE